jgi:hypothetical protein
MVSTAVNRAAGEATTREAVALEADSSVAIGNSQATAARQMPAEQKKNSSL